MPSPFVVRRPTPDDVAGIARVHVLAWQQTYRGLMSDEVLDDPGFVSRRERMWTALVTDPRYADTHVAIAERDGEIVGFASAGPAEAAYPDPPLQLFTIYLLRDEHGSGAGDALIESVLGAEPASLWVADPNPRAQAFYRKHGFVPERAEEHDSGVRELRMVREGAAPSAG